AGAVAVARTFVPGAEPFAGLDLVLKTRLVEEIGALSTQRQLTVVLVSHDPLDCTTLCRSAVVLDQGSVVEAGGLTDLLHAPRSTVLTVFRDPLMRNQRSGTHAPG